MERVEITKDDLLHFLMCWLRDYKVDLNVEQIFELSNLVNKCFDDKMMFDSWFRGFNVMD